MHSHSFRVIVSSTVLVLASACGPGITSDEAARRAYLGLDNLVEKSLNLGMQGFNQASSANIPEQSAEGDAAGTLLVTGQVDQGASANKGLRLALTLTDYTDGPFFADAEETVELEIVYATDPAAKPRLDLSLRDIPDGTFTGTLVGDFAMSGDLAGEVTLNIALSGRLESDGAGGIRRVPGSTRVTGTAQSGGGEYSVDLSI